MSRQPLALITGGSRGIGRATVSLFLEEGYDVVATATTEAGVAGLAALGPQVHALLWDARQGIEAVVSYMTAHALVPDVLVANAAVCRDQLAVRMTEAAWDELYHVNQKAPAMLASWALRRMYAEQKGSIVFLSSVVAHTGNVGQANYIATKSAVEGLTRALAMEGAPKGIRVNCVAPGLIETDMTQGLTEAHVHRVPLARKGSPEEVARCILFLARDATYMTGQVLHVNGGLFLG